MYAHLVLVLTATQYAMLSSTPFVFLVNPEPLDPPEKGIESQINATHHPQEGTYIYCSLMQEVATKLDGTIQILVKTIRSVPASASKAELVVS